jgi:c-di-GMP-related signal transduction protein
MQASSESVPKQPSGSFVKLNISCRAERRNETLAQSYESFRQTAGTEVRLEIIAEGIETKEHFRKLRRLGRQLGQGYLFSRPVPISEIERMLHERASWAHFLPSGRLASKHNGVQINLETTQ